MKAAMLGCIEGKGKSKARIKTPTPESAAFDFGLQPLPVAPTIRQESRIAQSKIARRVRHTDVPNKPVAFRTNKNKTTNYTGCGIFHCTHIKRGDNMLQSDVFHHITLKPTHC
jgi:hypothetical protein